MKLPWYKRIDESDFLPEEKPLIRKLANSLNSGFENVYLALSNRITLSENVACSIKEVELSVGSDGKPVSESFLNLDRRNGTSVGAELKIIGCVVLKAQNLTDSGAYLTGSPFVTWTQTQSGIQINHVTGLIAGNKYRLTVVAFN